ncbi:hypothetical protein RIR_jg26997.t2 [Rhizophagus irregularis DAOM 181602=DAOM 197198]|nr:hypothetical protein RIR_jg26997.t2 [Rhizophagus irregularis DAOM 181602=DAOM 197198]
MAKLDILLFQQSQGSSVILEVTHCGFWKCSRKAAMAFVVPIENQGMISENYVESGLLQIIFCHEHLLAFSQSDQEYEECVSVHIIFCHEHLLAFSQSDQAYDDLYDGFLRSLSLLLRQAN